MQFARKASRAGCRGAQGESCTIAVPEFAAEVISRSGNRFRGAAAIACQLHEEFSRRSWINAVPNAHRSLALLCPPDETSKSAQNGLSE